MRIVRSSGESLLCAMSIDIWYTYHFRDYSFYVGNMQNEGKPDRILNEIGRNTTIVLRVNTFFFHENSLTDMNYFAIAGVLQYYNADR